MLSTKYLMRILYFIIAIVILQFNSLCFAQEYYDNEANMSENVTFSQGTLLKGILQQKVSTEFNNTGDTVELIVPNDYNFRDFNCIPKNSKLVGKIIKLERAAIGKNGYFQVLFSLLKFPDGNEVNLLAHIWTKKGEGIIGGEATQRIGQRKVPHYIRGLGTIVQAVPDGPRQMGKETEVLPGTEWIIVLDKELKLNLFTN